MPVYDLGYRRWEGERSREHLRWWVIAQAGMGLAWSQAWFKRLIIMCWLPLLLFGWGIVEFERAAALGQFVQPTSVGGGIVHSAVQSAGVEVPANPNDARPKVWAIVLSLYTRYVAGFAMILMVASVAPRLISRDIGTRAFLIYFSRPVTRGEYIAGKSAIVAIFLLLVTSVPSLVLYALGLMFTSDAGAFADTWDLAPKILLTSAFLIVPATAISLGLSSLITDPRVAAFGWIAFWLFGGVAYAVTLMVAQGVEGMSSLSPFHMLAEFHQWVFGFRFEFADVALETGILTALTIVSVLVLFNRVSAPMRI